MGTNGDKIVVITGIIKIRDPCWFSAVKLCHTDASLNGSGRVKTLPYKLRFELFPFRNCQFVTAVVHGIICMALDPMVMQFVGLSQTHELHYHWVKGHADNPMNNRCDELAVSEWKKLK